MYHSFFLLYYFNMLNVHRLCSFQLIQLITTWIESIDLYLTENYLKTINKPWRNLLYTIDDKEINK